MICFSCLRFCRLLSQQLIWDVLKDLYKEVFVLRSLGYKLSRIHVSPFFSILRIWSNPRRISNLFSSKGKTSYLKKVFRFVTGLLANIFDECEYMYSDYLLNQNCIPL